MSSIPDPRVEEYAPGNEDYEYDRRRQEQVDAEPALPVRFSHLRAYGRSAAHGRHARQQEMKQTYAMQRGTAVHALLFGTRKVCGYPGSQRRGKDYDAFAAEHSDSEILTMAEYDKARRMADAVRSCKEAEPVLKGIAEATIRFRWMGLECRATPDVRGEDYLTELKTASSADPMRFPWHALRMHYHAQMRMQNIAIGMKAKDSFVVCVESAEPFPVQVFRIDEKALEAGEKLLILWAERLKNAEASQSFPAYTSCIMPIDLPEDAPDLIFPEDDDGN